MTFVGKILVIVIMAFALLFLGPACDDELGCDLGCRQPIGGEFEDFALSLGQRVADRLFGVIFLRGVLLGRTDRQKGGGEWRPEAGRSQPHPEQSQHRPREFGN